MGLLALILLVAAYFALSSSRVVDALRRFYDHRFHGGLLIATLLIPTMLAALPTARSDPQAFLAAVLIMIAYVFVPGLILLFKPDRDRPLDAYDIAAILALWFPYEVGWLPDIEATLSESLALPIPELTAVVLGFLLFLVIRPVQGLGYTFRLRPRDFRYALVGLAAFSLIGLPFGLLTGFIQVNYAGFDPLAWVVGFAGIYFVTALPEELLFRGIVQNLIEQRFGRTWATLIAAAVIFGLTHLNNGTDFHQPPNWLYAIMASSAGVAYGWVWRQSGKITGSAITHSLVNTLWGALFA